jgi:hypothetical protein
MKSRNSTASSVQLGAREPAQVGRALDGLQQRVFHAVLP